MKSVKAYMSRGQVSKLFQTSYADDDPEGLVSKYLEYELYRLKQRDVEPAGSLDERLKLLHWYVDFYGLMRHDDLIRIPLSAAQIQYLNAPLPLAGCAPAATIGLFNAVMTHNATHANLRDLGTLRSVLYWYCVDYLPARRLDDRLVTPDQMTMLRSPSQFYGEPFPLTVFMAEYFSRHVDLHFLELSNAKDRAAFFNYLLMLSFSKPNIARYLSHDSLQRALRPMREAGSTKAFEAVIGRNIFADPEAIGAREIFERGQEVWHAYGFSMSKGWVPPRTHQGNTGDCFARLRDLAGPIEDGVALIGPITSTSGLGQATRLSLGALTAAEATAPSVYPFKLDNPAPIGFASDMAPAPYINRRSINLIHLNAESIPLAFAYLQREMFESSYNIGYFFWELNKLPKCHDLALDLLDEIWVSSEYNREIYAGRTDIPVTNVGMAVEDLPAVPTMDRASLGLRLDAFVFLTTFDSFSFVGRKNPGAVVAAFRAAFPHGDENVCLVIKTQNRTRVHDPYQRRVWAKIDQAQARDARIIVIDETYRYRDLLSLKLATDCYVSLHRSEGWGFGMIEAMQLGRPVICTAYSGNMDFCSDETAYLVDYDLIAPTEEEYIFVERGSLWADPKIATAAARMREVVAAPNAAKTKAAGAKAYIKANFSVAGIGKRYSDRLTGIRQTMNTLP